MKIIITLILAALLAGCTTFTPNDKNITPPQLLESYKFPAIPATIESPVLGLNTEMLINDKGSVVRAKILNTTGDETWDSLAIESMMKWKYYPAYFKGRPIKSLVRQHVKIRFENPVYMMLGEILCNTVAEADSVYKILENGEDFDKAVLKYSISRTRTSGGILGNVDIYIYPENIQKALASLSKNKYTHPIAYGNKFIIFKRF